MRFYASTSLLAVALLIASSHAGADELVEIGTRDGVTQGFLVMEPKGESVGTVLMFPPEEGRAEFEQRANKRFKIKRGGWLGQTVRQYIGSGFTVAVIAPPSDQSDGMEEDFRQSSAHAEDMRQVIAYLTNRTGKKPFLAGTCRSTYSVSGVASHVDNRNIAGVILASTRTKGRGKHYGPITDGIKSDRITAPMLFVHHEDDDCSGSPYDRVSDVMDFFRGSAKTITLITVKGGYRNAERKQQRGCGTNGSHKFYGTQRSTVDAILTWLQGGKVPATINVAP